MNNVNRPGRNPENQNRGRNQSAEPTRQMDAMRARRAAFDQDAFSAPGGRMDEAGFFDPFAQEEDDRYTPAQQTAYELGFEDLSEYAHGMPDDAAPVHTGKHTRRRGGGAGRFREWFAASGRNKAIVIAGSAVIVAAVGLLAALLLAPEKEHMPGVIDGDDVQQAVDEGYSFVDESAYAGTLLTRTDDAGEAYIKDTLFIGDSNFARMVMYGYLDYSNVIGIESMGIQGVTSGASVYFSGYSEPVTIVKAVQLMKPRRIIICFGTNNILANDPQGFAKSYGEALDALKNSYEYSDIILCAIPPLGQNRSNQALRQETVDAYNHALIDLAKEKGYTYLDTNEVLKGSDGYIKPEYIYTDGIHLTQAAFDMFFKYVRIHAHIVEDTRPMPLGTIPRQVAPPRQETEEKEFDPKQVVSSAVELFVKAGCKSGTGTTSPHSWRYDGLPADAEPGTEVNWANNLYAAYVAQNGAPVKGSSVTISYETQGKNLIFTVTTYPVAECATHTWVDTGKKTDPTCGKAGQIERKCSVCGKVELFEDETRPATGEHTFGEWTTVTAATCGKAGQRKQVCSVCGETKTEEIPATGTHQWSEPVTTEATCTAPGKTTRKCSVCGAVDEQETAPAKGHSFGSWNVTVPASCTTDGSQTRTCSVCGATETVTIPAGHTFGEWSTTKAPTCTEAGEQSRTCSVCGATETATVPATGHSFANGVCTVCGAPDPSAEEEQPGG